MDYKPPMPENLSKYVTQSTRKSPIQIKLLPTQQEWGTRAKQILTNNFGYVDTSPMGAGKTILALWLAKQLKMELFIVCPVTLMDVWSQSAEQYGVKIIDTISYASLRSRRNKQPKHGYLQRIDINHKGRRSLSFVPTELYINIIKRQRVLVIFDEIQNIKNDSAQSKACHALIKSVIECQGYSRYGLLSGTPFDKVKHSLNLLRLIGYIRSPKLYHVDNSTHELILDGLQELIDQCVMLDRTETENVFQEIPLNKKNIEEIYFNLYTRVVKKHICGSMPKPDNIFGKFDVKNGFYPINEDNSKILEQAIKEWATAIRYNEKTGTADMASADLGRLKKAMMKAEKAKVYDICIQSHNILSSNKNVKVIICLNHHAAINMATYYLNDYNPLILTGKVRPETRSKIVNSFNLNDESHRLLIMNPDVGGVGVSMHDTDGRYPRYMFISPSYKLIETAQAANRIHRYGSMSDAYIRIFYGNGDGLKETKILDAMIKKTKVVKDAIDGVAASQIILPGDYESEYH